MKRRVCFGPVCECWLNWSRGAEVGEERERGNKYKTIELYTRIHPSIPKRSDPYSLYYFLTTTPLHCVTLRYTALLSAKNEKNMTVTGGVQSVLGMSWGRLGHFFDLKTPKKHFQKCQICPKQVGMDSQATFGVYLCQRRLCDVKKYPGF